MGVPGGQQPQVLDLQQHPLQSLHPDVARGPQASLHPLLRTSRGALQAEQAVGGESGIARAERGKGG